MEKKLKVVSDGKWKPFRYQYEVSEKVIRDEFSWLDEDFTYFIKYRNRWYHISEFIKCESEELSKWHGIKNETFFSGIVIQISNDGESYKIGSYYC